MITTLTTVEAPRYQGSLPRVMAVSMSTAPAKAPTSSSVSHARPATFD